jgi:hypothetical protein
VDDIAPTAADIADLTAWLRRITQAGLGATPQTEIDAFLTAKHALLERITTAHNRCENKEP